VIRVRRPDGGSSISLTTPSRRPADDRRRSDNTGRGASTVNLADSSRQDTPASRTATVRSDEKQNTSCSNCQKTSRDCSSNANII
jgi:hypothetical protein